MPSFDNKQINKLLPGLDKITQGYAVSSNSDTSVYGHSQPAGPSSSTTYECVFSPKSSIIALFAHHAQAAANPNNVSTLASIIIQLSQGVTLGSQNPETANQMANSGSPGEHIPSSANQPPRCRRKLITPETVLKMIKKQGMLMSLREIAAMMVFAKSTVAATLQVHTNCSPPPKKTSTGASTSTEGGKAHPLMIAIMECDLQMPLVQVCLQLELQGIFTNKRTVNLWIHQVVIAARILFNQVLRGPSLVDTNPYNSTITKFIKERAMRTHNDVIFLLYAKISASIQDYCQGSGCTSIMATSNLLNIQLLSNLVPFQYTV
ncbi:hypothetical protein DSO57_1009425 [Entomophthora muscae]|uniref:Uncharacterized protein n=1 Tax=Entomophthora muscae TaxID=34485 RepID=A0ACC2SVV3_9FUNG|nr:hypothetical protein DSO57_1009425 [Entomophthora muscae]